jgi:transglutaminase-like putative cysteine protease
MTEAAAFGTVQVSETEKERRDTTWLLFALSLVLFPHMAHLPGWASGVLAALLAWRGCLTWFQWRPASRLLLGLLAVGCLAGVLLHFRTLFGRDAGVTFLVLLLGVKLMEMRARRDIFVVIFLSFFVVLTNFFYSQTIVVAATMLAAVWALFVVLISVQHGAVDARLQDKGRLAGMLMLQAVPIALLLFFFFPRIQGPLWGLPSDAHSGTTGLSNSMSPGSLASLSMSDAVAFRARFEGAIPAPEQRYWRGPVLSRFDGRTWTPLPRERLSDAHLAIDPNTRFDYEVTLEPHEERWLFALEAPGGLTVLEPESMRLSGEMLLLARQPVRHRIRYEMRSFPSYRLDADRDPATLTDWLELPRNAGARARAWAASLRAAQGENAGARDLAFAVLRHIRRESFVYTLSPPTLSGDPIDQFFFDVRAGFCEHYAGSFVFLMRAMGVPARVVTGYQGGEMNPVDGYMVVRQADAHAWAEIFVAGQGWQRVDPTGAVSPERVQGGISQALPRPLGLPGLGPTIDAPDWIKRLRFRWDAVQNGWNQWVLSYNTQRQRALLGELGMENLSWERISLMLFGVVAACLAALSAAAAWSQQRIDPVRRLYWRACDRLAAQGVTRADYEGPREFAERVARELPGAPAQAFARITELFVALVYRPPEHRLKLIAELNRCVRRFKP